VPEARVALIGFMGCGKSTVGPILAGLLGYSFVDTDDLVVERAGIPIPEIFRRHGEPAFRRMETQALAELTLRSAVVIATGGGAPLQPANREFFALEARTFHLRVSFAEALSRTAGDTKRPLLDQGQPALQRLFDARLPVYESLGQPVETDRRSPTEIAAEIRATLARPSPSVGPGGSGG